MPQVNVNNKYELYQIITDFGNPLEIFREAFQNAYDENATEVYCNVYEEQKLRGTKCIIDIWNNGEGLPQEKVSCFFDVANSSKVDENMIRKQGKLGYKGHGSKIFFNSECVQICSKGAGYYWAAQLCDPIQQIQDTHQLQFDFVDNPSEIGINLPCEWESGFFVRIINPLSFSNEHTKFKLNHIYLRDYIKWYTIFGTILTKFDNELANKNLKLYLHGLNFGFFNSEFPENNIERMDPPPVYAMDVDNVNFEIIPFGHYFPENRRTDRQMQTYVERVGGKENLYYEYYSNMIKDTYNCGAFSFRLIMNIEGYETKRKYDVLLSRKGRQRDLGVPTHKDSERYGLWACIGGIPVEKVDEWIEGQKGVVTYMQAFIDCDKFNLTANRGSIQNTDIETLEIIKSKVSEIFTADRIQEIFRERSDVEEAEKIIKSVKADQKELKNRYKYATENSSKIILPAKDSIILHEPKKSYNLYSESETMVLLIRLMDIYPDLFSFKILDYNTHKGIDFVIDENGNAKYIELKGSFTNNMNHPFSLISKVICYDINVSNEERITDNNQAEYTFKIIQDDTYISNDEAFNNKPFTGYKLEHRSSNFPSIQVISLKKLLEEVIGAKFI